MRKSLLTKLSLLTAVSLTVSGIYCPTGRVLAADEVVEEDGSYDDYEDDSASDNDYDDDYEDDDLTSDNDYDDEEQTGTKISDMNLSNSELISFVENSDTNGDGYISASESEYITYLGVIDAATQSELTQILEVYTGITNLRWNSGTAKSIAFPTGNNIQQLYLTTKASQQVEISGISQKLTNVSYMAEGSKKYTFDFSKSSTYKNANYVSISGNQINGIKLPTSANVSLLDVLDTSVSKVSVSSAKVTSFGMYNNKKLKSVTVKKCSNLSSFALCGSLVSKLNISSCPKISYLVCEDNKLTKLNVSQYKNLKSLYCGYNKIKSINISKNKKITSFSCNSNNLTSVNTAKNKQLSYFNCSNNKIKNLSVSSNSKLSSLSCYGNKFTKVNLKKNKQLTYMAVDKTYKLLSSFIPSVSKENKNYITISVKKGTKLNLVKYAPALKNAKFSLENKEEKDVTVSKKGIITVKKNKAYASGTVIATLKKKEYHIRVMGV